MKILIVVDMQKDFISGPLGTAEARAIVPYVAEKAKITPRENLFVTLDTHQPNYMETNEGRHLPVPHCIEGTEGHALDNAIECVSQFDDPEKRLITLSMYLKNQLLMIQCENYTETSLSLKPDQLPTTTKQNAGYHGYGLKSIQQAARKYGGSMTLHAEDNWFTLQVLIPVES